MEKLLIDKVREHEILYNSRLPLYRDQHIRQKAWENIANDLGVTVETAKNSWYGLRKCFANALRRRNVKKFEDSTRFISAWKFESQMAFLFPFLEWRKSYFNIGESNSVDDADIDQSSQIDFDGTSSIDDSAPKIDTENPIDISTDLEEITKIKTKRIDCDDGDERITNDFDEHVTLPKKRKCVRKFSNIDESMDETDMFFISMLKMTKKLPTIEQIKIKKILSNAVLDAQLKISEDERNSAHSSFRSSAPLSTSAYSTHQASSTNYNIKDESIEELCTDDCSIIIT